MNPKLVPAEALLKKSRFVIVKDIVAGVPTGVVMTRASKMNLPLTAFAFVPIAVEGRLTEIVATASFSLPMITPSESWISNSRY